MKVRITSFFLATLIAISATGCSLKNTKDIPKVTESGYEQIFDHSDLQNRMISFIEKIEDSNIGIDLNVFYNNAKT